MLSAVYLLLRTLHTLRIGVHAVRMLCALPCAGWLRAENKLSDPSFHPPVTMGDCTASRQCTRSSVDKSTLGRYQQCMYEFGST